MESRRVKKIASDASPPQTVLIGLDGWKLRGQQWHPWEFRTSRTLNNGKRGHDADSVVARKYLWRMFRGFVRQSV